MSTIDFGRHSEDYAALRPGFPESFFRRLDAITPINGSRSLDLATGPGTIALELAARGSAVIGIDVSGDLIDTAIETARQRGLENDTRFLIASAEATGLEAHSFDLVTAGQSWHWFDAEAAMAEIHRVLRPGGLLAIAYYCYLAEHSPLVRDTERLVLEFNPKWKMAGSSGVFPALIDDVIRGGFTFIEAFCYDENEAFSHGRWRGRMRTCNGVGSGGLSPPDVKRFDEALKGLLAKNYPDLVTVPHRVWCVVARTRPAAP